MFADSCFKVADPRFKLALARQTSLPKSDPDELPVYMARVNVADLRRHSPQGRLAGASVSRDSRFRVAKSLRDPRSTLTRDLQFMISEPPPSAMAETISKLSSQTQVNGLAVFFRGVATSCIQSQVLKLWQRPSPMGSPTLNSIRVADPRPRCFTTNLIPTFMAKGNAM